MIDSLRQEAVRPQAVGQQRGGDEAALAGDLAAIQGGDDGGIERDAARLVAHPGDGARRRRAGIRAHLVHQPRARPVGGGVEAGAVGFLAGLAVGGEGGVDQPRIARAQVLVGNLQAAARRQRHVGDEHVGGVDEALQHRKSVGRFQIERDAALVARAQHPAVIVLVRALRRAGPRVQRAIAVAFARWLDLDDVRAEVRQHGGGRRRGDEARAIDYLQPAEQPLAHELSLPVCVIGWFAFARWRAR